MWKVLDHCMYNDNLTSRTFLRSQFFHLIKMSTPLFNCAIKQRVRNRWGEPTSWSATIGCATFPDFIPFGTSFFSVEGFFNMFNIWANYIFSSMASDKFVSYTISFRFVSAVEKVGHCHKNALILWRRRRLLWKKRLVIIYHKFSMENVENIPDLEETRLIF